MTDRQKELTLSLVLNFGRSCSHVRAVVATLGGQQGAAARADKWQHLYAGFTVWLSQTEAMGKLLRVFVLRFT